MMTTSAIELQVAAGTLIANTATSVPWVGKGTLSVRGTAGESEVILGSKRLTTVALELQVTTQNLSAFVVEAKVGEGADSKWFVIASTSADYTGGANKYVREARVFTTATGVYVDADLTTVEAAQTGILVLDVPAFHSIRVKLTAAVTGAVLVGFLRAYDLPAGLRNVIGQGTVTEASAAALLAAVKAGLRDRLPILSIVEVEAGASATVTDLLTAAGSSVNANCQLIEVAPTGGTVFEAFGAAAASPVLPLTTADVRGVPCPTKGAAPDYRLAGSAIKVKITQRGE